MTPMYCSKCKKSVLKPRSQKVRISENGGIVCDRCWFKEKGNKKGISGTKPHTEPREGMLKI